MAERYVTFAEVEQMLGLSADAVRSLMESRSLHGEIIEGVIKFRESEVLRLGGKAKEAAGQRTADDFVFLVDEEEEKKIEGKDYDGEALWRQKEPITPAADEEIMEPVDLSEEQRHNSALLGTESVMDFGRGVAERSLEQEFAPGRLAEEEEIICPSEVELPEPGSVTPAAVTGAHGGTEASPHEPPTPPEAAVSAGPSATSSGPSGSRPRAGRGAEEMHTVLEPAVEDVTTPETEEVEEEAVVGIAATAAGAPEVVAPEELPQESVEFTLKDAAQPAGVESPQEELTFLAEETGPMVCPVEEKAAEKEPEERPEPEVIEPVVRGEAELTFQEEATGPLACPVDESPAEAPTQEAPVEEKPEPAVVEPVEEKPPAQKEPETLEVVPAAPAVRVTDRIEQAVDEDLADLKGEAVQEEAALTRPEAPTQFEPVEKSSQEAEQVTEEEKKEQRPQKPEEEPVRFDERRAKAKKPAEEPEGIEVFDLEAAEAPAEPAAPQEEEIVLEEEEPAEPAKERTLEEEMAEIFGEETPVTTPAKGTAAAPAVEEDFDLSVFQHGPVEAEEPVPAAGDSLFEVDSEEAIPVEEETVEAIPEDIQGVSRIRALTEERAAPSTALFTAAIVLAFVAIAFAGMLLWYVFWTGQ